MVEATRPGQSPLVGREDECALLAQALDDAKSGTGTFVLIEGPAGIGKSRLAREVGARAAERGFMILTCACSQEDRGTPYAPIIDGLRDLRRRGRHRKHVAAHNLLDMLVGARRDGEADTSPASTQQADRARTADAMLELLDEAPRGAGCLVIVEDVHWADHATLRLLAAISRHAREMRIMVVLTYRDDELAFSDVLADVVHALGSAGVSLRTLPLRALTWSETRAMAQAELDINGLPPTALIDSLFARAEGNPFFTEQILQALPSRDRSGLDLGIPDQLPVSVIRLLEHRIKRLSEDGVRVLATAAVVGRRFEQATLHEVGDVSQRTLVKVLHEAIDAHLIRDVRDGVLEFQHALVREAAEGMLLSSERKDLHQRVAEALEARTSSATDSAAIAYHYGQAGIKDRLRPYAIAAADDAWRAGAPVEAARWYEQALQAAGDCGEEEPEAVLRRAADAFAAARLANLAQETFEKLLQRQRARGDALAVGETLGEFASLFYTDVGRVDELLREALDILEPLGETAALARVYGRRASLFVVTSQAREAIEAGRRARDIAKNVGAPDAEAVGRRALGTIVAAGGDLAKGYTFLQRSIELSKSVHKHTDVYLSSLSLLDSAIRASDWDMAERAARDSIDYARKLGSGAEAGALMARLADLYRFTGRIQEAEHTVERALLLLDEDLEYLFIGALLVKVEVLADLGRWQEVRDLMEPRLSAAERSGQFHIEGGALLLLARAARGQGRTDDALQYIERALDRWRDTQDNYFCLPALLFACQSACERGDLDAARAFVVELQAVFARTPLCVATILAAEGHLATAEGRLDDAVRSWSEAAESFDALGRATEAARARLALGRTLLVRRGPEDRDAARAQLLAVQTAAAALPEAAEADSLLRRHRLVSARSHDDGGPLTEREAEVVALIAEGLTNRRIAEELTLSARTVENHVSRILDKLQLESRSQIVAYAISRGMGPSRPPE